MGWIKIQGKSGQDRSGRPPKGSSMRGCGVERRLRRMQRFLVWQMAATPFLIACSAIKNRGSPFAHRSGLCRFAATPRSQSASVLQHAPHDAGTANRTLSPQVTEGCGTLPGLYPCGLVMALPLRGGCRRFAQRYLSGGAAMHPSGRCAASSPSRGAFGGCLNTGSAGKNQSSRRLRMKTKQPAAATTTSRA